MDREDYDIEVAKEYTNLQERIATLEKENAELKCELKKWKDGIALKDEEIGCIETDFNTFKSKAKEIIGELFHYIPSWTGKENDKPRVYAMPDELRAKAEQFISEVEK